LVTHAFPNFFDNFFNYTQLQSQLVQGPYSRSYYVISTTVRQSEHGEQPSFDPHMIGDLASVWFGKRFDLHGEIERSGCFWMPYGAELSPTRLSVLGAYNHQPRKDLQIPLNLVELSTPIMLFSNGAPHVDTFWKASSFYARSLRAFEDDPEVAFLHLISALEIIASQMVFPEDKLFDAEILADLKAITDNTPDGATVAQRIKSRLFQIRKRVVLAALELTNDTFFAGSESREQSVALTKERLEGNVQAAYDVRSSHIHRGGRFSLWVDPQGGMLNEIQLGKPFVPGADKELADNLSRMPTFLGLERLVRFMTLRFAHLKIMPLHDRLN